MFRLLHAPSISKKVSPFYCYTETITFCCIYIYCIQLSIYCCLFILFLFVDWNGIRRSGNTIRFHVDWNETANQVLPWYYTSISVYILWLSLSWDGDGLVFFFPKNNTQEVYTYFPYDRATKSPFHFLIFLSFFNRIELWNTLLLYVLCT